MAGGYKEDKLEAPAEDDRERDEERSTRKLRRYFRLRENLAGLPVTSEDRLLVDVQDLGYPVLGLCLGRLGSPIDTDGVEQKVRRAA